METGQKLDVNSFFVHAASTFAEALHCTQTVQNAKNSFGRNVAVYQNGGLARLLGLSATGLRSAAIINAADVKANLPMLASFKRMHVPFTLVVHGNALGHLADLAATGCIIYQAFDAQQVSDFILIAQVISEKSLMPVVVLADVATVDALPKLPSKKELIHWFGDNDGRVPDPTPAQTTVLGKMRRRMPGWLQTDNPVMLGAQKNHRDSLYEVAAQQQFDDVHIQHICDETLAEFEKLTARKYTATTHYGTTKTRNAVLTTGHAINGFAELLLERNFEKNHVSVFVLRQLWPLAVAELKTAKLERLLVLEAASLTATQGFIFKEISALPELASTKKQNGWYAANPTPMGWQAAIANLLNEKSELKNYWLDVPFTHPSSAYPKHQVLLQQVARDYPQSAKTTLLAAEKVGEALGKPMPAAAKQFANQGPPYARLSRFFDDTACLYDQPNELVAHPFQAIPALPVGSAMYNYPSYRKEVPVFNPKAVNTIERYPSACPHGALLTSLFTLGELIKSGIAQARSRGEAVSVIVPLSKVWAKNAATLALEKVGKISLAKEVLAPAWEKTLPTAKDQNAAHAEYEQIMLAIAEMPIAVTENHFAQQEKAKPENGELFTLAIDPSACTGCGNCVFATAEGALEMKPYAKTDEAEMARTFNRFDALPETSAAIVQRLLADQNFDSFAALLLNKNQYRAFARGGVFWQKGAEASTMGMLIALAEYALGGNYEEVSKQISVQTVGINNVIKKILSDALPVTNLESLMEVVTGHSEEKLNMDRIFDEWGKEQQFKAVNKDELQRKLELVEGLKQLKWALKEGLNGTGRAKYSVVLDASLGYAAQYPWNTFNVPVLFAENGQTAALALGMFEGELRNVLDNIRLLRRAALEAEGKYKPEQHDAEIVNLSWADLTPEERVLVAPIIVFGSEKMLTEAGMQALLQLTENGYPVKIIAIESGTISTEFAAAHLAARGNALFSLMAQTKAFVGRGSLANSNHLFALGLEGLKYPGPAVIGVFTPNAFAFDGQPSRWPQLAQLAVTSRMYLPLRYAPGEGTTASCITLEAENINQDWNHTQLVYADKGEEKSVEYTLTFADYAYLMNDWKGHFTKLESAPTAVAVADYLNLDEAAAKAKTPVIKRIDAERNVLTYAVSAQVIAATRAVRQNFRLLREWAGLHTEFPEKLREAVENDLRVAYEADKKKLVAELAAEKKTWEAANLENIKIQMKERLLQMAGQL
jgi:NAD-dependent dihydropyrimidine dehydrogenase PreA subunit